MIVKKVDKSKLYSDKKVREEHEQMKKPTINENPPIWDNKNDKNIKICSLNCARLKPHIRDTDYTIKKSDNIHL